jgi:hypothetical protein
MLLPVIAAAQAASSDAPPGAQELSGDSRKIEAAKDLARAEELSAAVTQANTLVSFLKAVERGLRDEILERTEQVIGEISSDIEEMWGILHPNEAIENVGLYVPDHADKAVDIKLRFYGVEQDSPRLTLSEGYRNSLGLCIFLALAKREAGRDRPLFLDDVVVSLDRNHRGMIVELLEREFSERQVILFTHHRGWYTELRHLLDASRWASRALMPWDSPRIGIRWSEKTWAFDDARARVKDSPDTAGNTARKIMDIELAMRAERLKLKMPYLHREKNDHRGAHDFLMRLISDAKRCFRVRDGDAHKPHKEAVEAFQDADRLLLAWGDKASHRFDLTPVEAEKLVAACESALGSFDCAACSTSVYKLEDRGSKLVQCRCGLLQWRYGNA